LPAIYICWHNVANNPLVNAKMEIAMAPSMIGRRYALSIFASFACLSFVKAVAAEKAVEGIYPEGIVPFIGWLAVTESEVTLLDRGVERQITQKTELNPFQVSHQTNFPFFELAR
jgi:hypothetical protein